MSDTPIEVPELDEADTQEVAKNLDAMMVSKYSDRIAMWMKDHKPHQKFPVSMENGVMTWANRATRRSKRKSK